MPRDKDGNPQTRCGLALGHQFGNTMNYTQIKLKPAYRAKLKKLADDQNRSMANMVEVLIDRAVSEVHEALEPKQDKESE